MINFVADTVQVHVTAFFEEYKVYKYLVLKRSLNVKVYPGIWQVITGTIEQNETALQTALRETMEEISCEPVKMWTLPIVTRFFSPQSNSIKASPVFGMLINSESDIILSEEHEKYEWLHLDLAVEKLALLSHREATRVFHEYILSVEDKSLFELDWKKFI